MKTMKKTIITRMLVLTLAISGLFVIGNNVYSNQLMSEICQGCAFWPVPIDTHCPICGLLNEGIGGGVHCHQHAEEGRFNVCWLPHHIDPCYFTGSISDWCIYPSK
jgi:hypothetical protein